MNPFRLWPFGKGGAPTGEQGLALALDELTEQILHSGQVDLEALCKRHPDHAADLDRLVTAVGMLAEYGTTHPEP